MATAPAPAFAAAGTLSTKVFENANMGGDSWILESTELDLRQATNGLHHGCNTGSPISIGWNDCISSFTAYIGPGRCLEYYTGVNVGGQRAYHYRNTTSHYVYYEHANLYSFNDTISSIRFGAVQSTGCKWSY